MAGAVYVWSPELQLCADRLPANQGRSSLVHGLVQALGLLQNDSTLSDSSNDRLDNTTDGPVARLIAPARVLATEAELKRYHDTPYVGET